MHPLVLATLLREAVLPFEHGDDLRPILVGDGNWTPLPEDEPYLTPVRKKAVQIVEDLHGQLKDLDWRPGRTMLDESLVGTWHFGEFTQRAPIRQILRGFLEPVRRFPIVQRIPELVVHYLISLPDNGDYLKRERHANFGWHYHYMPDENTISDVILSWDTRWATTAPHALRPIFQEKHGEGRYHFEAKPWLWGDVKRESMHRACVRDLDKWSLDTFRCASDKAQPVWPTTASLTPRPGRAPTDTKVARKKKRGGR